MTNYNKFSKDKIIERNKRKENDKFFKERFGIDLKKERQKRKEKSRGYKDEFKRKTD